ncbi:MAG: hypothetical protein A2826_01655 [Candidatus Doudnabacteria bacterium RIFCSPHIGHO2_01_FULL_43_23]|uniref:Uncharacterized protein n=1 Tax=Candidatus Doudnabacteria bacterium RIFCSPHIGHO2_01_FULL_43_23 TaxID=1817822 RepID=A0A1F5NSG2_9BACT|nr:MAG: hypothetical protein A2826_01655 [Candidatus Doudnabacteria bacterium RIFCSPHIGHO2_01_FULL_43_23]
MIILLLGKKTSAIMSLIKDSLLPAGIGVVIIQRLQGVKDKPINSKSKDRIEAIVCHMDCEWVLGQQAGLAELLITIATLIRNLPNCRRAAVLDSIGRTFEQDVQFFSDAGIPTFYLEDPDELVRFLKSP